MKMILVFRYLWSWMIVIASLPVAGQQYRYPLRSAFLSASGGFEQAGNAILAAENPALLMPAKKIAVCGYVENEYGVRGLNFLKLAATLSSKGSGGGFLISHLGNIDYREVAVGIHYGKSLGAVTLGAVFRYNYFSAAGATPESCIDYAVSMGWQLTDRFFGVVSLANPYHLQTGNTAIAPWYSVSFGWAASESVFAETRLLQEEGKDFQASIVLHFRFANKWIFHTGCWPLTFRPFVGLEWQQSQFRLLVNVSYHPTLGASPGLLVNYEPENPDEEE